jgi:hypothetical protein
MKSHDTMYRRSAAVGSGQLGVFDRQLANASACGGEYSVPDGWHRRRHAGLAHPGRQVIAGQEAHVRLIGSLVDPLCRLHDLTALAVAALGHVARLPGQLYRMVTDGVQALMVTMFLLAELLINVTQLRPAAPSTRTVQAPQSLLPQPYLLPVNCNWSRRYHNNGIPARHRMSAQRH